MKSRIINNRDNSFTSFEIGITIETEAEAEALYALFNHTMVLDLLQITESSFDIRQAIRKGLDERTPAYSKFHSALSEHF